jgi:hypothetical protein
MCSDFRRSPLLNRGSGKTEGSGPVVMVKLTRALRINRIQ